MESENNREEAGDEGRARALGSGGEVNEGKVDVLPPSSYLKVASAWEQENKKEGRWYI